MKFREWENKSILQQTVKVYDRKGKAILTMPCSDLTDRWLLLAGMEISCDKNITLKTCHYDGKLSAAYRWLGGSYGRSLDMTLWEPLPNARTLCRAATGSDGYRLMQTYSQPSMVVITPAFYIRLQKPVIKTIYMMTDYEYFRHMAQLIDSNSLIVDAYIDDPNKGVWRRFMAWVHTVYMERKVTIERVHKTDDR